MKNGHLYPSPRPGPAGRGTSERPDRLLVVDDHPVVTEGTALLLDSVTDLHVMAIAGARGYLTNGAPVAPIASASCRVGDGGIWIDQQLERILVGRSATVRTTARSTREQQVLELLVAGLGTSQIGERLQLKPQTVSPRKHRLQRKTSSGWSTTANTSPSSTVDSCSYLAGSSIPTPATAVSTALPRSSRCTPAARSRSASQHSARARHSPTAPNRHARCRRA